MSEELIEKICHQLSLDVYRARGGKATIQWRDVPAAVRLAVGEYEASRANEMVPDIRGIAEKWSHNWTAKDISMTDCIVAAIVESLTATTSRPATAVQVPEGYALVRRKLDDETWKRLVAADVWPVTPQSFQRMLNVLAAAPAATVATEAEKGATLEYEIELHDGTMAHITCHGSERDMKRLRSRLEYLHNCEAERRAPVATEPVAQGGGVDVEKVMALVEEYGEQCEAEGYLERSGSQDAAKKLRESAYQTAVQIRALLSASPAGVGGWKPIDTAPRDGTAYIAFDGETCCIENAPEGHFPGVWTMTERGWRGSAHQIMFRAAYWLPLPPLPAAPAIANQEARE